MAELNIPIKRLANNADLALPKYATSSSAGADLIAAIDAPTVLETGDHALIQTGIAIALPTGFEAQVRPRSGLAAKHGVTVLNAPGTIDADYRGEIGVILINHGRRAFVVKRGMRIAQLVVVPVLHAVWQETDGLDETARGDRGFGSTGVSSVRG
jgi:dUTP pyrophosphatase